MTISKTSNLDSTRRAVVRKGSVVEFPGGATARVCRVRLGSIWLDYGARSGPSESWFFCSQVRVIS